MKLLKKNQHQNQESSGIHSDLARKHKQEKQKRKEGPYRSDVRDLNYVCIREILAIRRSTPLIVFKHFWSDILKTQVLKLAIDLCREEIFEYMRVVYERTTHKEKDTSH